MSEENKAIVNRLLQAFNSHDYAIADELIAPGYTNHDPVLPPGLPNGPEGFKALMQMYLTAFPDLRLTVEQQLADGDCVITRWLATGTHQGELMGMAPTGKQATVTGIAIDRIEGGRVGETYEVWDTLGLMQQLGAIQAPAAATA